jgi:regulator of sigma E protease
MDLSYPVFTIALFAGMYIVYMLAFFTASLALGIHENHYVLGFGKPIFSFTLRKVKFSIAWFIPVFGLARIRAVVDRKLVSRRYPWEFEFASKTKRLVVTLSGTVALVLTGMLFYIVDAYTTRETLLTKETINRSGVIPSVWAREVGFQKKDQVLAINGENYGGWFELNDSERWRDSTTTFTIMRNGKQLDLRIGKIANEITVSREPFLSLYVPFEVGVVVTGSPADEAGLQTGDRIVKVNGEKIVARSEMIEILEGDVDGKVMLHVLSKRKTSDTLRLEATLTDERRLGFTIHELIDYSYHAIIHLEKPS